jgi:hypothetical protein
MASLRTGWRFYLFGLTAVAALSACGSNDKSRSATAGPLSGGLSQSVITRRVNSVRIGPDNR